MLIQRTRTMKFAAARAAEEFFNWLYPASTPVCIVCHRPLPSVHEYKLSSARDDYPPGICLFCLSGHPSDTRHPLRGKIPLSDEHSFEVICAAKYDGWLREAIRHWKYDGALILTAWFAERMVLSMRHFGRVRWDGIVPVPTASDRIRKRGYDHVGILSRHLSRRLRLPIYPVLQRVTASPSSRAQQDDETYTQSQTTRSATERAVALFGQFNLASSTVCLKGKAILLVDDVVTTGATMQACARLLANEHIKDMYAMAIAHVD